MSTRALWETVLELADSVRPTDDVAQMVRVTRLDVTLPIEMRLRFHEGEDVELLGDVPQWRWTTPFDVPTSRLTLQMSSLDELLEGAA
jgi:hypothetical protein